MARRRFFASSFSPDRTRAQLTGEAAHHLARVLRAQTGQEYELAWEGQAYLGRIERISLTAVDFVVLEALTEPSAQVILEAGVAVFKFDRFEWMLEKATELGLTRLWPLVTRRTDTRLGEAAAKRSLRWQQIVQQASEQSRRFDVPVLDAPLSLEAFLALAGPEARWLLDEAPGGSALPAGTPCRLLLGPEGGWTPEETAAAHAAGYAPVSLGPRILRCETALLAALTLASRRL